MTSVAIDYPEILPQCITFPASKACQFPFMALVHFGIGIFSCIVLGIKDTYTHKAVFCNRQVTEKTYEEKTFEKRHILL